MLNEKDWDFCQIQFNYMDTEIQAGLKGYRLAEERKVPVIVMEPIKGGSLTTFADDIVQIFEEQRQGASLKISRNLYAKWTWHTVTAACTAIFYSCPYFFYYIGNYLLFFFY